MTNFLWKPEVRLPIIALVWVTLVVAALHAVQFCIVSYFVMMHS